MTVKELIAALEKQDPGADVVFTGYYQTEKRVPCKYMTFRDVGRTVFVRDPATNSLEIYNTLIKE